VRDRCSTLKDEQRFAFDEIMNTLRERQQEDRLVTKVKAFILQGRAGVGKTYLLSLLRDAAESEGMMVEVCATTGIAASLYRGGRTLLSFLGTGIEYTDNSERNS